MCVETILTSFILSTGTINGNDSYLSNCTGILHQIWLDWNVYFYYPSTDKICYFVIFEMAFYLMFLIIVLDCNDNIL